MGIFNLIIAVPAIVLYGLCAVVCLKALRIKINAFGLLLFIVSGFIAGAVATFIYGLLVADQGGQLNSASEVVGMFGVSVFFALLVSVSSVKFGMKYNTALKRDRAKRAAP